MLKLKLQNFSHLMQRTDTFEKTLMLGKIEGGRRGWQRIRLLDGITESMEMSLSKLREWWCTRRPSMLQSMRLQRVQHNLATELNLLNDLIIDHSHYSFNVKTDSYLANAVPSSWVLLVFDLILRVLGHFLVFWQDVSGSRLYCFTFLAWDPNSIISPRNTVSFMGNGI